jgi:hypothetical protein
LAYTTTPFFAVIIVHITDNIIPQGIKLGAKFKIQIFGFFEKLFFFRDIIRLILYFFQE